VLVFPVSLVLVPGWAGSPPVCAGRDGDDETASVESYGDESGDSRVSVVFRMEVQVSRV